MGCGSWRARWPARAAGRGTGYLLELSLAGPGALPDEIEDLDGLAAALARCESYAVVVVTVGSAANPLLAGRYGGLCPPAPTQELLTTRLRERLEEHVAAAPDGEVRLEDLLTGAEELAVRRDVKDAVGLKDLRPPRPSCSPRCWPHTNWGRSRQGTNCWPVAGGLAADQAQEWFAGVDRALTALPRRA